MTQLYEELFLLWCVPHEQRPVPDYLKDNPTKAYGAYAFEEGFKLGMQLAVSALDPNALSEAE